jgi:hypothetical protein
MIFKINDHVRDVPYHAHGNRYHEDCEEGFVTSMNEHYIFVRFGNKTTSQACKSNQLINLSQEHLRT